MSDSNSGDVRYKLDQYGIARRVASPVDDMPAHQADGHVARLSELAESMGLHKKPAQKEAAPVNPRRGRRF